MSDDGHNKRAAPRKTVLGHGLITGPTIHANCVIRDISSTGAKLGASGKITLPATFDLCLVKTQTRRRVLLRWRRGDFAGVEFCQAEVDNTTADASDKDVWVV